MRKKRQRRLCLTLIVIALLLIVGCIVYYFVGKNEETKVNGLNSSITNSETETLETIDSSNVTNDESQANINTIQAEIAEVEAKSKELENTDTSNMSQFEMNSLAGECFQLWDAELNSIWERLSEKLPQNEKDKLVKEQQEWITQKERNADVAGVENGGGSLAPLLMSERAADMTKVRVYQLAKKLADIQNESFEISSDVQKELDQLDYSLEDVLENLEGQWIFDSERGACIGIERSSESAYGQDDSEWTIWITGGDLYTEKDVYGYIGGCIVLHKEDDETSGYTVIDKWDDSVSSWYAGSINDLMNAVGLEESIVGY